MPLRWAAPAAGMIAGIGTVSGVTCVILCNDATVKGGTIIPYASKNTSALGKLPKNAPACIYMVDSGGANLPNQDRVSRQIIWSHLLQSSTDEHKGHSTSRDCDGVLYGGRRLCPCDVNVIIVKEQEQFSWRVPLGQGCNGRGCERRSIGRGRVHTRLSGVADYLAVCALARRAVSD